MSEIQVASNVLIALANAGINEIHLSDEEEEVGKFSIWDDSDRQKVIDEMNATGFDTISFDKSESESGWIDFVWGNCHTGDELIADHADNSFTRAVVNASQK